MTQAAIRRAALLSILCALVITPASTATLEQTARSPLYVVTFDRFHADYLTLTYERRLELKIEQRFSRTVGGFAARLSPRQLEALRGQDDIADPLTVARSGEAEFTVLLSWSLEAQADEVIARLERDLQFRTTHRFLRTMRGFSARLTATQLRALDERPEVERIVGHPAQFTAEVALGADGVRKAEQVLRDLELTPRHAYREWFSFETVWPWQLARLEADPDISRLSANFIVAYVDPWENPSQALDLGRGLGSWILGMPYLAEVGLIRSETRSTTSGCSGTPATAEWIDYYPRTRLSWQGGRLTNIATTRPGASTQTGFRIGVHTLQQVRARFPSARFSREFPGLRRVGHSSYRLGQSLVEVTRKTGRESWATMHYWFDRQGKLVALETLRGDC